MRIVPKPVGMPRFRNSASSEDAITISGVAMGMKMSTLVAVRPLKRWRTIANAIMVPSKVAPSVESAASCRLLTMAGQRPDTPHGFSHDLSVKPCQVKL